MTGARAWIRNILALAGILVLLPLPACSGERHSPEPPGVPIVAVSILPIGGIVDRLLPPGAAIVQVLVPAGASPHSFEPGMEQLALVQGASLMLEVGHPAFAWERVWLDGLLAGTPTARVSLSTGCQWIEDDPHVLLDPVCLDLMAERTAGALIGLLPDRSSEVESRLHLFREEIRAADDSIRRSLRDLHGRPFLAQHAAWGYFARAYGLDQIAILSHGSGDAGAARLAGVIDQAREARVRAVLAQPQFSVDAAMMVARDLGIEIRTLDPLRRDPLRALMETAEAAREGVAP